MEIDEERERTELSDHSLIEVTFKFQTKQITKFTDEWVYSKFRKINEKSLKEYIDRLADNLDYNMDIKEIEQEMNKAADATMTRTIKKKITTDKKSTEAIWFDESIRKAISKRREINCREKQKPRRKKKPTGNSIKNRKLKCK